MNLPTRPSAAADKLLPSLTGLLLCCALLVALPSCAQAPVPVSSHVVLVIEENTSFATTLAQMPWLVSQGSAYGYAANYISDTPGSLMDYLWLASGSCHSSVNCALPAGTHNFNCTGDSCTAPITDDNIFREMNNRGIQWKVYAQSYAAAGGTVTTPDFANGTCYARRHNGATWYSDIVNNVNGSQSRIVDFSQFAIDLTNNALPQFSIIVPDVMHDAHDGTPLEADVFLHDNLTPMLAKSYFQPGGDGLLIVTFDNGDGDAAGPVYTAVIGPQVTHGMVSNNAYRHENTLRTLLDALSINTYPGASATASPMNDFFSGSVTVTSPARNSVTGSNVLVNAHAVEALAPIYQLQVWDATTGQKLADSPPGASINQVFNLAPGQHQLIVEDINAANYQKMHWAAVNITVSADGVNVSSPAQNSTSGTQVLVSASAHESNAQIYQLQVWDATTGQKLADSPPGASINQVFNLAPGQHQLVVEDISIGTYQAIHQTPVNINVAATPGVTIMSPNRAPQGRNIFVGAYANSSSAIHHMEVWDVTTGAKLGDSFGSQVSATYALSSGQHILVVQSVSAGSYQVLNKNQVAVAIP